MEVTEESVRLPGEVVVSGHASVSCKVGNAELGSMEEEVMESSFLSTDEGSGADDMAAVRLSEQS